MDRSNVLHGEDCTINNEGADRTEEQAEPTTQMLDVPFLPNENSSNVSMESLLAIGEKRTEGCELDNGEPKAPPASASVHLFSMRISQHLRSLSGQSAASSIQQSNSWQHTRARSSRSNISRHKMKVNRRRQVSSSGFASTEVPVTWGTVVKDAASSVYSTGQNSPVSSRSTSRIENPLSVTQLMLPDTYIVPIADLMPAAGGQDLRHSFTAETTIRASSVADPFVVDTRAEMSADKANASERLEVAAHQDVALLKISTFSNHSSTSLGKASRFKEELDMPTPKRQSSKVFSAFRFLIPKAGKRDTGETLTSYDGSADESGLHTRPTLRRAVSIGQGNASNAIERALQANQEEKSALFLSPDKAKVSPHAPRERSSSFSRRPSTSGTPGALNPQGDVCLWLNKPISTASAKLSAEEAACQHSFTFKSSRSSLRPLPTFVDPLNADASSHSGMGLRRSDTSLDPFDRTFTASSIRHSDLAPQKQGRVASTHGNSSTSKISNEASFETSDSAYSLAAWSRYPSHTREQRTGSAGAVDNVIIRDFAMDVNPAELTDSGEDGKPAQTSKKKRKARTTVFGKNFLRNYVRLFGSQSAEFRMHGHGHRTSVAAGGTLEYPELELLPSLMRQIDTVKTSDGIEMAQLSGSPAKDSDPIRTSAEIQRPAPLPTPTINIEPADGTSEVRNPKMWSKLYESCVEMPGSSDEAATSVGFSGLIMRTNSRLSKSNSLPTSLREHARNTSVVSVGSLRASTVDLCRMLREAEIREREKLLRPASEAGIRLT